MTYMYDPQLDGYEFSLQAQEHESKLSVLGGPALPALGHAVSGATGAAISNLLTYPLSLAITRLQVQRQFKKSSSSGNDEEYKSISDVFSRIYAEEGGVSAFYAGCVQDTMKSMADSFLFFLAYNFVRRNRIEKNGGNSKKLPVREELVVGMVAGAFSKFFTTPVQQIVTRKQTAAMVAKRSATSEIGDDLSARAIARQIRAQKGLAGFWSGYSASLILTLNPSLTMLFHETLLRVLVKRDKRKDPGLRVTFLLAAMSKAMASTITYPFSLAKSRAQVSAQRALDDDDDHDNVRGERISEKHTARDLERKATRKARKDTIFDAIVQIAREEGVAGLYQGLSGEVLKGFFSHGLTMLMKERIHNIIIQLYYLVLKSIQKYPSADELSRMASEKVEDVKEVVADKKEAVADFGARVAVVTASAGKVAEQGQEVLEKASDMVAEWYRKGKEEATNFVDDYVSPDDDDEPGSWW